MNKEKFPKTRKEKQKKLARKAKADKQIVISRE